MRCIRLVCAHSVPIRTMSDEDKETEEQMAARADKEIDQMQKAQKSLMTVDECIASAKAYIQQNEKFDPMITEGVDGTYKVVKKSGGCAVM